MPNNQLERSFFTHSNPLIAGFVDKWTDGKLITARGRLNAINTVVQADADFAVGKVVTYLGVDANKVPTYVMHRVERGKGSFGIKESEGVGTFLAFQAVHMMVAWARENDGLRDFQVVIQAPPGFPWGRFVDLMDFSTMISVLALGEEIQMPGKRYKGTG